MFGKVFYNKLFRSYTLGFGTLFNNIVIGRFDANNVLKEKVLVPLIYSSKEQYFTRAEKDGNNPDIADQDKIALKLPLMAYIQSSISREDARKTAAKNEKELIKNNPYFVEQPSQWKIGMTLSIIAGSQTDMDQIIEQILPYFSPSFTYKLNLLKDTINYVDKVNVELNDISYTENNFDGPEWQRRRLVVDIGFSFIAKLFGPVYLDESLVDANYVPLIPDIIPAPNSLGKPIHTVVVDMHNGGDSGEYYDYPSLDKFPRVSRTTTEMNGEIPESVTENFNDGKVRNIVLEPFDITDIPQD